MKADENENNRWKWNEKRWTKMKTYKNENKISKLMKKKQKMKKN